MSAPTFQDFLKVATSLAARVTLWSIAVVGLNALLSLYGASIGLSDNVGLYIWAAFALLLAVALLGPLMTRLMGRKNAIVFFCLMLIVSAGLYFAVWLKVERIKEQKGRVSGISWIMDATTNS